MIKAIVAALLLFPSVASAYSCEVVVCAKQNNKIIPPALQAIKKEECFVATVAKKDAVEGASYKPMLRSVQTAYRAKRLYVNRVIGCTNFGGNKND